jgi:hypothetical protein
MHAYLWEHCDETKKMWLITAFKPPRGASPSPDDRRGGGIGRDVSPDLEAGPT